MSTFSDEFREEMVSLKDEVLTDLITDGIVFNEDAVLMAVASYTGEDTALGVPGTQTIVYTEIEPRPKLKRRDVYRNIGGVPMKVGDAVVEVSRSVALSDIESASWFDIGVARLSVEDGTGFIRTEDGAYLVDEAHAPIRYTIVEGEIRRGALAWTVVLKRELVPE